MIIKTADLDLQQWFNYNKNEFELEPAPIRPTGNVNVVFRGLISWYQDKFFHLNKSQLHDSTPYIR